MDSLLLNQLQALNGTEPIAEGDDFGVDIDETEDVNSTEKRIQPADDEKRVIYPYGFVAEDWHWMIELAVYNVVLPGLVYAAFEIWSSNDKVRNDTLRRIAIVHGSVWTPVIILGLFVEVLEMGRTFTAVFLEHWSSNLNQAAYLYSMYELLFVGMTG